MKSITIFCSASDVDEKYTKPAKEFALLLAKNGYTLVWGGTDKGLMHTISSAARSGGSKLVGISIPRFQDIVKKDADEIIIAKTLGERKALLLQRGDAVVALVGGIGTLDEITEIIELRKQGHHDKPIVILNTENFYEGLKVQLQKMKDDGFIPCQLDTLVYFADQPFDAIAYINRQLKK